MKWESFLTIHNIRTSPADVINQLEAATETDLYRSTLRVQNELHVAENIRYLSGHQKWASALYEFAQGRYDFVILRAVLQHLKDPDRFMKHVPNVLQDQAALLFFETTKENFIDAHPPMATFDDLYQRLETIQKDHAGSRDCIAELAGQLEKYPFKLFEAQKPMIPIRDAQGRAKIVQYLILGCAITRKTMSVPVDLNELFADLLHWHDAKNSRLNLKSQRMLLEMV